MLMAASGFPYDFAAQESQTLDVETGPPLRMVQVPQEAGWPALKKAQPPQARFVSGAAILKFKERRRLASAGGSFDSSKQACATANPLHAAPLPKANRLRSPRRVCCFNLTSPFGRNAPHSPPRWPRGGDGPDQLPFANVRTGSLSGCTMNAGMASIRNEADKASHWPVLGSLAPSASFIAA